MKVLLNCGACPDMHNEEADGVILLKRNPGGGLQCPSYVYGRVLAVIVAFDDAPDEMVFSMPHAMTKRQIRFAAAGLEHLRGHYE